jgi:DNA-binding response OmpR family regulator
MKTILIVDDAPRTVEPLKMILELNNYKVEIAYNRAEAEQKAKDVSPDLILLDIMLPPSWTEEGIGVCRDLKNNDRTRNIPIIILTNRGEEDIRQKCLDAGADGFINKIFSKVDLLKEIEKALQKPDKSSPPGRDVASFFAALRCSIPRLIRVY